MLLHSYPVVQDHLMSMEKKVERDDKFERNMDRLRFQEMMMRQHIHNHMLLLSRQSSIQRSRGGRPPCNLPPRVAAQHLRVDAYLTHNNFGDGYGMKYINPETTKQKSYKSSWDLSSFKFTVENNEGGPVTNRAAQIPREDSTADETDDNNLEECLKHVYRKAEEVLQVHASKAAENARTAVASEKARFMWMNFELERVKMGYVRSRLHGH